MARLSICAVALATLFAAVQGFEDDSFRRALTSNTTKPTDSNATTKAAVTTDSNATTQATETTAGTTAAGTTETTAVTGAVGDVTLAPVTFSADGTISVVVTAGEMGGVTVSVQLATKIADQTSLSSEDIGQPMSAEELATALATPGAQASFKEKVTFVIDIPDVSVLADMFSDSDGDAAKAFFEEILVTVRKALGDFAGQIKIESVTVGGEVIEVNRTFGGRQRRAQDDTAQALTLEYEVTGDADKIVAAATASAAMTDDDRTALAKEFGDNVASNDALANLNMTVGGMLVVSSPIYVPTTTAAPSDDSGASSNYGILVQGAVATVCAVLAF